jgi:Ca2+/H+ antiporter
MIPVLVGIVIGLGLLCTVWGVTTLALNKPVGRAQLIAGAVLEVAALTQTVIAIVLLAQGHQPVEFGTTVGYLIVIALIVPIAAVWALNDRSRYAGGVLAVAAFAVLAMTLRLLDLWGPA